MMYFFIFLEDGGLLLEIRGRIKKNEEAEDRICIVMAQHLLRIRSLVRSSPPP